MARAAYGRFEDALRLQHLDREHYLAWAIPFHEDVRSNVGFVEGGLFHLWHGEPSIVATVNETRDSLGFGLTHRSIFALGQSGVWRWSSGKVEMHEFVRDYFFGRKEDG